MRSLRAVVVLGLALLLASCSTPDARTKGTPAQAAGASKASDAGSGAGNNGDTSAPVPVVTVQVAKKNVPVTLSAVGTAEAIATVQVRSQVAVQLIAIGFNEGDVVKKGQLLFSIDPRPFEAALAQAQAALQRDQATASNQQSQQARYADLFNKGLIAKDQFETQTASASAADAVVAVDKAAVQTAELNLQYTRITAPMAGKTGSLGVHVGDLVRANDTTPMVVVNQESPIYVAFAVPARNLAEIRQYQARQPLEVESTSPPAGVPGAQPQAPSSATPDISPGANPGRVETGRLTFIDNAADATTGTIKLRATFANADSALWPGLFVQVTLTLRTEPDAVVVPAAAVQVSQSGQYVYLVKSDGTAEMRPVKVERQQGHEMVIAQGLSGGEEVVTDGQLRLTPGTRVTTEAAVD